MIGNIILDCGDFYNMMEWNHMSWLGFPFFALWFIGVIVAIVIIVYIIIRNEKTEESEVMSDAHKTLDNRYAKGEMTREEYVQAKEDLKNFNPK